MFESRHTETSVWRKRVCDNCHFRFITEEALADTRAMPTEVHRYKDATRKTPRTTATKTVEPKFDTAGLTTFRW